MKAILVPYNNSAKSMRALEFAVVLASAWTGCRIHVLFVRAERRVYGEIAVYQDKTRLEAFVEEHALHVLSAARERLERTSVPFSCESLDGNPARQIAQHASRLQCDLIVMGNPGFARWGAFLMDAVTTRVAHLSSVPVTLVP